jgi:hypothetical protein
MGDHPVQAARGAAARAERIHRPEADGLDDAVGLASGCPIVADGGTVDVYETIDVGP